MARIIRIGVDATTWWDQSGFGRFTRGMVTGLAARADDFRYTLLLDRQPDETLPLGVESIVVSHARHSVGAQAVGGGRAAADLVRYTRAANAARFDLFFFPTLYSYFPLLSGTPVVATIHDTLAERYPRLVFPSRRNEMLWRLKARLATRQARRILTVSRACADDIERHLSVPSTSIDVATEGADPVFRVLPERQPAVDARLRYGIPQGAMLLTYVGGISPHKNLMALARALPLVLGQVPDIHLAIVGGMVGEGFADNREALRTLIRAEGLEHHVHFTGRIDDEDLVALLNGTSALAYPSLWEGFGLPAVEAMACGVPVLASRRGSLPEVVSNAGLFFEPNSPRDIADTILRFAKEPDLRRKLASEALQRASRFTWERGAEMAERCFRRALFPDALEHDALEFIEN